MTQVREECRFWFWLVCVVPVFAVACAAPTEALANPRGELIKRELLVLFGNDTREFATDPGWPRDTETAVKLQTPLEWMGYELRYHNVLVSGPVDTSAIEKFGGLIVDGSLHVPTAAEGLVVDAVASALETEIPVLFFGSISVDSEIERSRLMSVLGMRGTDRNLKRPATTGIVSLDREMMNFEADVRPRNLSMRDLQAPEGADVFLSVAARDASGTDVVRHDQCLSRTGVG